MLLKGRVIERRSFRVKSKDGNLRNLAVGSIITSSTSAKLVADTPSPSFAGAPTSGGESGEAGAG